jgi:GT2 family glycosyltransferase
MDQPTPGPDLSVRGTLRPRSSARIPWAAFDPHWYLRTYPAVRDQLEATDFATLLQFYLDHGQALRHAPNVFFDERFFLDRHAAAICGGQAESGFDAYCRAAGRYRRPHWLFDEAVYREQNADLTDEALAAHGLINGYHHYLHSGSREGRTSSPFFDNAVYLKALPPEQAEEARGGPFAHYLHHLAQGGTLARTTRYFDPSWYFQRYREIADQIESGTWWCPLHHYLANDTPTRFDPLPEFSEEFYLASYPDIQRAVEDGRLRNGYEHYLRSGARELRSPSEGFDLRYYIDAHRSVRADLERGAAPHAFAHYLAIGRAAGLPTIMSPDERVSESQAKALFRARACNLLPVLARQPLDFTCAGRPDLTVIMVLYNQFPFTMMALASLRQCYPGPIELLLVDNGSDDETRFISRYVRGAMLLQVKTNLGFVRACNAALVAATADTVLFLNNDTELCPGAVGVARHRLASDPRIGAVGGKIIRTHGKLQEAGSILWRDGTSQGYLRDASPLAPEANFVREVDYCSAAFLMVRADLLRRLEGFAEAFIPAYYEDADLCVRIRQSGFKLIYDPSVVIHHYEYGSATSPRAVEMQSARSREAFIQRNRAYLRSRYVADKRAEVFARSLDPVTRRILFIDDQIPLSMLGSGFARSNDVIRVMASLGYHVTVFPMAISESDVIAVFADMPETVEVMHNRSFRDLAPFLLERDGYYDTIWVVRTHNLDRVRPVLECTLLGNKRPPRIILDTEAIATNRDALQAQLRDAGAARDPEAVQRELSNAAFAQTVLAVNSAEAEQLRAAVTADVIELGHLRALTPTSRPFNARAGLLFVGAIHARNSPNYDGLCWFIDEVLPHVEAALAWETRLTVIGYTAKEVSLERFRDHPRVTLRGTVFDLKPAYDRHRLFVAPTRYAAGLPYKPYEAASHGLPIVATELLRRQLGWTHEAEILAADSSYPEDFAALVVKLYGDAELWERLRTNALERLRQEASFEKYKAIIKAVIED